MKQLVRLIVCSAVFVAIAPPAHAQNQYRFEVFGSGNLPRNKDFEITTPQSKTPMKGQHEFSLGGRGGLRVGVDGKGHWGADIIYSFGTNPSRIVNQTNGKQFSFNNRTHQVSYNALWYPGGLGNPKTRVFPFLTIGVGGTFYTLSQTTINEALDPNRGGLGKLRSDHIFAMNAGGGVRLKINSLYGFRFDIRDYLTRPARYGLPRSSKDANAVVFPVGGIFHQLEFSFAFVYYFK